MNLVLREEHFDKIPVGLGYGYPSDTDTKNTDIDNELGRAMIAGDERAFSAFVARWQNYTVNYVKSRMYKERIYYADYADSQDAQEITSNVFQALWKATGAGRYSAEKSGGKFVKFFYGVLKLETRWQLSKLRTRRQGLRKKQASFESATVEVPEQEPRFDFEIDLEAALLALKPPQRLAFYLCDVQGCTRVEAGEIMQMYPSSVKYHQQKAYKRLRVLLASWR